jgi:hypothetical protein
LVAPSDVKLDLGVVAAGARGLVQELDRLIQEENRPRLIAPVLDWSSGATDPVASSLNMRSTGNTLIILDYIFKLETASC